MERAAAEHRRQVVDQAAEASALAQQVSRLREAGGGGTALALLAGSTC